MSLFQAYSAVGGFFVALGALLIFFGERIAPALEALPRSRAAGFVLWGGALAWFLWHLTTIPAVDLAGFPRSWLLALFGGAGLLAFKFLPDLLALRGLAVLALFFLQRTAVRGLRAAPVFARARGNGLSADRACALGRSRALRLARRAFLDGAFRAQCAHRGSARARRRRGESRGGFSLASVNRCDEFFLLFEK